jgi:gas vesicle protein
MDNGRDGERIGFLLLGAVIGAAVALLLAPEPGARTRRRLRRKGEDAADYLLAAGKDLVEDCEDLRERSGELLGKGAHALSDKYRELADRSKELLDEATALIRRPGGSIPVKGKPGQPKDDLANPSRHDTRDLSESG